MAKREWSFDVDGSPHTVNLEHRYFSGKRTITVDGASLDAPQKFVDTGGEYPFTINGHEGFVQIKTNGLTYSYDCILDGASVCSGKTIHKPKALPVWSWIFMIACCLIPIITLGGALPALIGFGGAFACAKIGRSHIRKTAIKVLISSAVLLASWILFAVFLIVMHLIRL
jgi:hypothetical protein